MKTYSLQAIVQELSQMGVNARLVGEDVDVYGATADSRNVWHQALFICKGAAFKSEYLAAAITSGATAYLCTEEVEATLAECVPGVSHVVADDLRKAMALASAASFGHPEQHLKLVGITGTKGKTTCASMTRALLEQLLQEPVGCIGTHEVFDGDVARASSNTTPEAPEIYETFASAVQNKVTHFVMEVSSQALKYERTLGLSFLVGAFLNISPDHISPTEHLNYADYEASKLKLFGQAKTCIVNASYAHLAPKCAITYGIDQGMLCATELATSGLSTCFSVFGLGFNGTSFLLAIPGVFNVENALCALAIVRELGFSAEKISSKADKVFKTVAVPGRMEVCVTKDSHITCVVDYAHNKTSFEKFFETMQATFPEHVVIAVFGACGNRALNRIEELPLAAESFATHIILTADEPGPMKPQDIVHQMAQAIPSHKSVHEVPDRDDARKLAFSLASDIPGPVLVCFLGKGDEDSMQIGEKSIAVEPDTKAAKRLVAEYNQRL